MSYKRKTKDIYIILTNYGYGWEEESCYSYDDYNEPYKEAKKDAKEYQLAGAETKIIKRRILKNESM